MDHQLVEMLLALLDQCQQPIALFDCTDTLRFGNPAFRQIMGLHSEENPTWIELIKLCHQRKQGSHIDATDFEAWLTSARGRRGKLPFRYFETDLCDGRWMHVGETTLANGWMICIFSDITDLTVGHRDLRYQRDRAWEASMTDELTGLGNRRYMMDRLHDLLRRSSPAIVTVAALDIDLFKSINDTFGHQGGDIVLQHFSSQLQQHIRRSDLAGRIGGEEFLLIFPDLEATEICRVLDRLYVSLRQQNPISTLAECHYSFSAGVAQASSGETMKALLHRADVALYQAKTGGRNQYQISLSSEG